MLLLVTVTFLLLYAVLILFYFYHWLHIEEFVGKSEPRTFVSVVIAARNEEKNIGRLLKALQQQTYPANFFEIVIVDDYSTDNTASIVKTYGPQVQLIQPGASTEESSKKKAIEAGVQYAKGELVVITDADCLPGREWLHAIVSFQQRKNAVFIAAPVKLKTHNSLLSIFQSLDFITLQGITAASVHSNSHSMCNGANLAYLQSAFFEVEGFKGIDKLASGDDMLLMYKIWKKYPDRVCYLKNRKAIIETEPMMTWKDFFYQRIRWSSKATYYQDWRISAVLVFVYLFNCLLFLLLLAAFIDAYYWRVMLFYLIGKILIEFPFVYSVAKFYREERITIVFPLLQPLHVIYTVVIGLLSQFGSYQWKGRKTK